MRMMKPVPVQRPLPCYSLEYNKADPRCQVCPHQTGCVQHSGRRAIQVPLSKAKFRLIPDSYEKAYDFDLEDPELPHVQRTYFDCYDTIFNRAASDDVTRSAKELLAAARQTQCSLRLYILANMVGHRESQKTRITKTEQALPRPFRAKMLLGTTATKRARMYAEMCNKEFGTFALSSLSSLVEENFTDKSLEKHMLHSETVVGKYIVGYKILHGGPAWDSLFDAHELTLDPYWLAIDETYLFTKLQPYLEKKCGTEQIQQHRFSVTQVLGYLKKHSTAAVNTFHVREAIMPQAVAEVLHHYGHQPDDFNIDPEPIVKPLEFWVYLGRALQQFQCLLYLEGKPSLLARR
jgi:hypothetical protein